MSKKKKSKLTDVKLDSLIGGKITFQNQIRRHLSQIDSLKRQWGQEKGNRSVVCEIENSYKKKGITHLLKFNTKYIELKKTIKITNSKTFENMLSSLRRTLSETRKKLSQADKEIRERQEELRKQEATNKFRQKPVLWDKKEITSKPSKKKQNQGNLSKAQSSQLCSPAINVISKIFYAEWENVKFANGFILIEHNGRSYRKEVPQSKKYLNEIKHYYKFHNIPKLKVIFSGSIIKDIENQEVLFFHIDFLSITASSFGLIKLSSFQLSKWTKYKKQYYKTNLPFVFHTYTLERLCEYCDPDLPIIPVGEVVINRSGSKTVHNSFLFPIKSKVGHSIVWESTEEAKASYVFSLNSFTDKEVQTIFNYIAGDTPNKRSTLINSKSLQDTLKMKNRVFHKDLTFWDYEIRQLC